MTFVLGVAGWPIYARVVRAETLAIGERDFVVAGRALGMSHLRLIFRQIVPNLLSVIVVIATLQVAQVIVLESFLSFLGLGVQPPTPAWGNMLGEGASTCSTRGGSPPSPVWRSSLPRSRSTSWATRSATGSIPT
jgi:ABC-type dipeptide/oligopeptide/nickel transport system permease subunit